jgi:hypothetical protein
VNHAALDPLASSSVARTFSLRIATATPWSVSVATATASSAPSTTTIDASGD